MKLSDQFRVLLCLSAVGVLLLTAPDPALSTTGQDVSTRIQIDGFVNDEEWEDNEALFQPIPGGGVEESTVDSRWGRFNDLNNIRITWDADSLYLAIEGFIFDNNTMIFFDTLPNNPAEPDVPVGLSGMTQVNSWRRALTFDNGFFPDFFVATWDGNTSPQTWQWSEGQQNSVTQVVSQASNPATGQFSSVATFSRDLEGRALEAAIPWDVVFLGRGERVFSADYGDSVYTLPTGVTHMRVAAWITTGADGLGGPDTAPDNLNGLEVDSAIEVVIDNFAILTLDEQGPGGSPGADRVADFGVAVRTPTTPGMTGEEYQEIVDAFFFVAPPIRGQTLELDKLEVSPRAIAPALGDEMEFSFGLTPELSDPELRDVRTFRFTAQVYDLNAQLVRTLYRDEVFTFGDLDQPTVPAQNRFDGRDNNGELLDAGIYVLRVVLEPGRDELKKSVVVVR